MMENSVIFSHINGVRLIKISRPVYGNVLNIYMCNLLTRILSEDAENERIFATVITGTGNRFLHSNDLFLPMDTSDIVVSQEIENKAIKEMISAFQTYPKLLIAVVNGSSSGIGNTIVALCHFVYASDQAVFDLSTKKLDVKFTFQNFLYNNFVPENLIMNVEEAFQRNFVANVIPHEHLDAFLNDLIKSLVQNKEVIMKDAMNFSFRTNNKTSKL